MGLNLKVFMIAAIFPSLLSSVSYGAERGQISISDESFRPEVRAAIKNSSEVFRLHSSSIKENDLVEKRQELSASLLQLQQLSGTHQDSIENEWLELHIKALEEMIEAYKSSYGSSEEKEAAVDKVLQPAMQTQWHLIQKSIWSSQLRDYLHELYAIGLEKRKLENHPEKADERLALQSRTIIEGEAFLIWFDNKPRHDTLTRAELIALDKVGI